MLTSNFIYYALNTHTGEKERRVEAAYSEVHLLRKINALNKGGGREMKFWTDFEIEKDGTIL